MSQSAPAKSSAWYNKAETVLLAGSIGGSVAAVVLQQITFAAVTSIQLSLVVGIGSWNRKRFDEINQQNQSVITQLQQQILQGQQRLDQATQTTQQLPSYKEIVDLQHHLERLEADHQKRVSQLYGDLRNQESQQTQLRNELTSLYQALQSSPYKDVDLLQDRIHNLKAHFELKIRDLEKQFNRFSQPLLAQLEDQVSRTEQNIVYLLKSAAEKKEFEKLFAEECQNWKEEFQKLSEKLSNLDCLVGFSPEDMRRDIQILLNEIQEIEVQLKKISKASREENSDQLAQRFTHVQSRLDFLAENVNIENKELHASIILLNENGDEYLKLIEENHSCISEKLSKLEKRIAGVEAVIKTPTYTCDWCGSICHLVYMGGLYDNCKFCSKGCRDSHRIEQERNNY